MGKLEEEEAAAAVAAILKSIDRMVKPLREIKMLPHPHR